MSHPNCNDILTYLPLVVSNHADSCRFSLQMFWSICLLPPEHKGSELFVIVSIIRPWFCCLCTLMHSVALNIQQAHQERQVKTPHTSPHHDVEQSDVSSDELNPRRVRARAAVLSRISALIHFIPGISWITWGNVLNPVACYYLDRQLRDLNLCTRLRRRKRNPLDGSYQTHSADLSVRQSENDILIVFDFSQDVKQDISVRH